MRASCVLLAGFLLTLPALADVTPTNSRTWISGVGDDYNPGSRTAPVRTLRGALSLTVADGLINMLDPVEAEDVTPPAYDPMMPPDPLPVDPAAVTITRAVTVNGGPSGWCTYLNPALDGLIINAGSTDTVVLRNLMIDGSGTGLTGIKIVSAGSVYLENCIIKGQATGIEILPTAGTTKVFITNCLITNCTTAGISMAPTDPATLAAKIARTRVEGCALGISVQGTTEAVLTDNTVAHNTTQGLKIVAPARVKSFKDNRIFSNTLDQRASASLPAK